ncbi:hypothetical protein C0993_006926 [Termitomyces sp. T159_Od127]|nr:hypothetical protein C0993_006926 [Termitomyces sp. T159_Od127]
MSTPTADAFLASASFITCANLLLVQVQGLGTEAPCNKVEGMMCLWQKWRMMQGGRIMWERDGELLEWCMARYHDNLAPPAPSFDEELEALLVGEEPLVKQFWQDVAKESEADAQWCITNSLEALVCEGLGLEEATGAGESSQQGQEEEEEESTKETTPDTMAGAATGVAMPAPRKAPMGGAKGLASPTKKGSPTKLSSKRRGHPTPRQAKAVVDTGVEAGVVLKETKEKATVDLATCQVFKEERGACNKCWADNDSEGCWYPVGAPHASAVVEKAREAEAQGEAIGISKKSLALPTRQGDEERGSGKGKQKASLPLLPMDKGKKRARVVSPAAVTPEVESEEDDKDKVHRLSTAIEASKAALSTDDLAGPTSGGTSRCWHPA